MNKADFIDKALGNIILTKEDWVKKAVTNTIDNLKKNPTGTGNYSVYQLVEIVFSEVYDLVKSGMILR